MYLPLALLVPTIYLFYFNSALGLPLTVGLKKTANSPGNIYIYIYIHIYVYIIRSIIRLF